MLTRGLAVRALLSSVRRASEQTNAAAKRYGSHGSWAYRCPPAPPSKRAILLAELGGALMWYWILYHCVTEPEHIFGDWPYIHPSTWTDEELGVPPDSAGSLRH